MPFTNAPDSSDENFFARSTASFKTTLGGVSVARNSCIAKRKIARSISASRSESPILRVLDDQFIQRDNILRCSFK